MRRIYPSSKIGKQTTNLKWSECPEIANDSIGWVEWKLQYVWKVREATMIVSGLACLKSGDGLPEI